ncbi:hypothetical protein JW935_15030 [candidate division KSB1 bacterium]|nr:hypothetical protein [candidate division KSB1 bacterium]
MCPPILSYENQKQEFDFEFVQKENYYSFRASFVVNAAPDCLIHLVYNAENIGKYSLGAKSIMLGQHGEDWYLVTFTYQRFLVFQHRSTWLRTLDRRERKITFKLISNSNNINIIPEMLSSNGYYQFKHEKEGSLVEYFQECRLLPGFLKTTYINMAKKEAIKFLHVFKVYLENGCD